MAGWEKRVRKIEVGDTVAYSASFLQSTGQYTGDAPHARGKVTALLCLSPDVTLAQIEWDTPGLPNRVHVRNLTTAKGIAFGE